MLPLYTQMETQYMNLDIEYKNKKVNEKSN